MNATNTTINITLLLLAGIVTACSTTPEFIMQEVLTNITPAQIVEQFPQHKDKSVLMGGVIINVHNIKSGTELEILAYPLDSQYKVIDDIQTTGRFIARSTQYMEAIDYTPGKQVSLTGKVIGREQSKIGEAEITYPVIDITQIHLWRPGDDDIDTRLHFGIGIVIHN